MMPNAANVPEILQHATNTLCSACNMQHAASVIIRPRAGGARRTGDTDVPRGVPAGGVGQMMIGR